MDGLATSADHDQRAFGPRCDLTREAAKEFLSSINPLDSQDHQTRFTGRFDNGRHRIIADNDVTLACAAKVNSGQVFQITFRLAAVRWRRAFGYHAQKADLTLLPSGQTSKQSNQQVIVTSTTGNRNENSLSFDKVPAFGSPQNDDIGINLAEQSFNWRVGGVFGDLA